MTTTTSAATGYEPLPAREKFCYGFGDLASCLYWQTFMLYLTYFYTDVFGITAAAAGTMILVSRSTDAFFDPVMGMIADRTRTRWGKFRPYLLWFCVPMAVLGVFTFTVPSFATSGKLLWAYVTYNALMLCYTAINIPYTALLGVISPNPADRTALSSIKFVGAYSGGILISAFLLPMAKTFGAVSNPARGWQLAFVAVGVIIIGLFLLTFFNTRERVKPPQTTASSIWRDLGDLFTNGPWVLLLAATLTFILFVAARSSVTVHYFKYYIGEQKLPFYGPISMEGLVSVFNTSGQLASLAGVMLVPFLARRLGRKPAFVLLFVIAIVSTASFYVLKPSQVGLILLVNLLGSITGGPLSALLWAMYADSADYAEWKNGRRATGLVFSASIFAQKQGWAIAGGFALFLMQSVGFVANTVQTGRSLHGLVILMSLIPAGIGIVSLLIVLFYPLGEARMSQISAELKLRRQGDNSVPISA